MTPQERYQPKIINGSRRARIARGSGVTVTDVNQLIERFADAQKMMRQLRSGRRDPGHARHGRRARRWAARMGGGSKKPRGKQQAKGRKGKARSGNPAKRAQQEKDPTTRTSAPGAAFGATAPPPEADPFDPAALPPGFEKFLGR